MNIRILLTGAVASAAPLSAAAQDRDRDFNRDFDARRFDWSVRAMGSYIDTDDLGDAWGGMVGVGFHPIDWFSAELRSGYLQADDENLDIVPLELVGTLRYPDLDVIEPYAGVGLGYYFLDADDVSTDDPVSVFPLVGLDVRLPDTNLRLFGEARYLFFDDRVFPGDVDSTLDGFGANFGVSWTF